MTVRFGKNYSKTAKKKPKIKWRNIKKKSTKKKQKYRKRKCDKCKKRFDHEFLVIHHKTNIRKIPNHVTEGMVVTRFDKLYADKRKRPVHDKRDNIMILCRNCYKEMAKR